MNLSGRFDLRVRFYCVCVIVVLFSGFAAPGVGAQSDMLVESDFIGPPIENRPGAFCPWLNGSVTRERISYELEQMKAKGMSGADIWDVRAHADPENMIPAGPPFLDPESLEMISHTIKEGGRLGLRIGMLNSSGWNAGGTWTTPEISGMVCFIHRFPSKDRAGSTRSCLSQKSRNKARKTKTANRFSIKKYPSWPCPKMTISKLTPSPIFTSSANIWTQMESLPGMCPRENGRLFVWS